MEAGKQADDQHETSLDGCRRSAAQRPAEHERSARHRRDQRLFQEPELPVPNKRHAVEDGAEDNRHADDAGSKKLEIVPLPRRLEYRAKPVPERKQKEYRLAQRADEAGAVPKEL